MTWTYTPDFTTQRDRIRREIGDVLQSDQILSDEEIAYAGTVEGSDITVAARCCDWAAAFFGRKADITEGKLSLKLSQRAQAYRMQAAQLRSLDSMSALPSIGGESITDKEAANADTDRVPPAFFRGMTDNPRAIQQSPSSVDLAPNDQTST